MALHPNLTSFRKARHVKAFSSILKKLEKDLAKLGSTEMDAEIVTFDSPKPLLHRLFSGPGYGDTEELLIVTTSLHRFPVEIIVPMGKQGIAPPYMIDVILPETMIGRAEYRHGLLGGKWHLEQKDKKCINDLKRTLPKVRMKQHSISKTVPVGCDYTIQIGYSLEPTEDGRTEWVVNSGYEGGILTGGNRPMVAKYLEVIPAVLAMLQKWNRER